MPTGGHARSGPMPDPNSQRSLKRGLQVTVLPAAGHDGDAPDWPLNGQLEREAEVWTTLWKSPQATQWIDQPWRWLTIGMYVRTFVRCEMPMAKTADVNALPRLADEIGLSQPGLKMNGWTIGTPEVAEKPRTTAPASNARDRLKLVMDDSA